MRRSWILLGLAGVLLTGCRGAEVAPPQQAPSAAFGQEAAGQGGVGLQQDASKNPPQPVLAYIGGAPILWQDLQPGLVEANGGQVLAEVILERMIAQRLTQRGMTVEPDQLEAEKALLIETLGGDEADQTHRLLQELRQRRGLGEYRFARFLKRNAGLRALVQDEVEISDAAINQAYQLEYGSRYEARLIVTDSLQAAAGLVQRARQGESFIDLAIAHSTDPSRAQGGLIGPINPADPTYPKAVRTTLQSLEPGQVADPVALDEGFAVLRLERKLEGQAVEFETVKDALAQRVRRRVERMLMQRLARTLLREADVIVLDSELHAGWQRRSRLLLEGTP